jgi:O-antigen/teichoic acid export membrane protein
MHDASINPTSATPPGLAASLRRTVARGAAAALLLRAGGMGLAVITGILLARTLGPAGYGTYAWAFAWGSALAIPAALGADQLLSREAGVALDRGHWDRLRALIRSALCLVAAVSLGAAAAGAVAALALGDSLGDRQSALLVALPILPLAAIAAVAQGTLLGLGKTAQALGPGTLGRQAALLLLVGIGALVGGLSALGAVALQLVATAAACIAALALTWRALARMPASSARPRVVPRDWLPVALPMGAATMFLVVDAQIGLVVLGATGSASDAGVYAAALQCLAPFVLVQAAGRMALTSAVARLGAAGKEARLQRGLRTATRAVAAVSAVFAAVLLTAPGEVLGLFGGDFPVGAGALRILAAAYLINSLCAFNGMVLTLRGQERVAMRASLGCLALDAALCLVLVPPEGARGAALAALISVTARNAFNSVATWRRLGIDTTVLGRDATLSG